MKLAIILFCCLGLLILVPLDIALFRTDLGAGMFCMYQCGYIWTASGWRLLPDTPQNRRRVSRWIGTAFLIPVCIFAFMLFKAITSSGI